MSHLPIRTFAQCLKTVQKVTFSLTCCEKPDDDPTWCCSTLALLSSSYCIGCCCCCSIKWCRFSIVLCIVWLSLALFPKFLRDTKSGELPPNKAPLWVALKVVETLTEVAKSGVEVDDIILISPWMCWCCPLALVPGYGGGGLYTLSRCNSARIWSCVGMLYAWCECRCWGGWWGWWWWW